ncbi:MAG: divergent polysaccharide deacetylase family protein [Candidatus Dadabacteria bacterium]
MPAKPSRTTKRTSRRPTRRNKSARVSRIVFFTIGFIALLFFTLYGINYLKQNAAPDYSGKVLSATEIDNLIKDIDLSLTGAFFEAGISSKNIESKKVINKEEENLTWQYKDIRVSPEEGVTPERVKKVLEQSVIKEYPVEYKFKSGKNSLTALININNITTHKIQFDFNKQNVVKAKAKQDKTEKVVEAPKKEEVKTSEKIKSTDIPQAASEKKEVVTTNYPKSKIVIIVDDLGMNKNPIDQLLKIAAPITFAVLPNLPYSTYAAEKADKKGWDVILHMPMEPKESSGYTGTDAGDEVLLVGLPKETILTKLNNSLASVPHVKGVNNHMGSKFMENSELTELILKDLQKKGLLFVDSKTSSQSTGYETAMKLGMKTAQRDIFLDDFSKSSGYVKDQLKKLIEISKKRGYAVGICHPYPKTLKALSEMIPLIGDEVEVVSISNIINSSNKLGRN